jgi:hypothetical protein
LLATKDTWLGKPEGGWAGSRNAIREMVCFINSEYESAMRETKQPGKSTNLTPSNDIE